MKVAKIILAGLWLSGCAADIRDIGVAPHMTPVGAGLNAPGVTPIAFEEEVQPTGPRRSLWDADNGDLYRDARAAKVGDLITVVISINDSASLGNTSNRERDDSFTNQFNAAFSSPHTSYKYDGAGNATASTSTKGQGNIDRSEKIQLSVAAVVTQVFPNGNLFISGSQEVRVNFELRELMVEGVVRPRDVSRDNMVGYDKIAEARISYGGRGRLTEVQQPALIHQILDLVKPF